MSWLWLNIPLMAAFSLAVAGVPMWLVLRRPEPEPVPVLVPRPRSPAELASRSRAEAAAWTRWAVVRS
jgi:hypothetical protein